MSDLRSENTMLEPRYEKTEIAQCVGCIALIIYGGAYDVSLVSFSCGVTWTGALVQPLVTQGNEQLIEVMMMPPNGIRDLPIQEALHYQEAECIQY